MRAAIYTRISDDRTGNGAGVERQEKECRELAGRLGWEVVAVCSDNNISAYKGHERPGFNELQDMIRSGKVDGVIAWAADRLTRHPRELENLVDLLNETRTTVQTVTSGKFDLTTADGRAVARIVGAIARQESEKKSERVKSQKAQSAADGARAGGPRAYGWTPGRNDVISEELAVVREIGERVLRGEGINTITKDLNARGLKTARGNDWTRHTVRQLCVNPATAGLRRQPDGGVVPGQWEGAWHRDVWNRLCAVLDDPARMTTHRLRSYLLTGLVYDGEDRRLIAGYRKRGNGSRIYRTPANSGGNGVTIPADVVEDMVIEAVLRITDTLEIPEPVNVSGVADEIQAQLDDLAEMFGRGEITAGEWNAARGPLNARLVDARIRPQRATLDSMDWAKPGLLRASWDGLTLQQQRQAIDLFVDQIIISPGRSGSNTPDPNRVSIVWKA
ncbi:MAG: recombinase family protein [Acidobacteria bacterium]|nr:recombinase family protein [Acidobacteriota bacterium]